MQSTAAEAAKAPISDAQLLANQANAQKSTGPRTEEGKARSKMNARRHGLTGQFYVMNEEDGRAYAEFERGLFRALAPVGEYEQQLSTNIAQNHWRLNRARAIEFNNFGLGHEEFIDQFDTDSPEVAAAIAQAQTWIRDHQALTNLTLYETRIERMITKNKRELDELQRLRKATEAEAREKAEQLLRLDLMKSEKAPESAEIQVNGAARSGLIPTPVLNLDKIQVNGFVFSTPELLADISLKDRLQEAAHYAKSGWKHPNPLPKAA